MHAALQRTNRIDAYAGKLPETLLGQTGSDSVALEEPEGDRGEPELAEDAMR